MISSNLEYLEGSKEFLNWKKGHQDSYLAHIFRMFDEANTDIWQFGYYNANDTMTTFFLDHGGVKSTPEQEIFKKGAKKLPALKTSSVKIDFPEAMKRVEALHQEKYASHPLLKSFAILQVIDKKPLYNATLVTKTFYTLNVRVDARDGSVVKETFTSLMEMAQFEKGKQKAPDYIQ